MSFFNIRCSVSHSTEFSKRDSGVDIFLLLVLPKLFHPSGSPIPCTYRIHQHDLHKNWGRLCIPNRDILPLRCFKDIFHNNYIQIGSLLQLLKYLKVGCFLPFSLQALFRSYPSEELNFSHIQNGVLLAWMEPQYIFCSQIYCLIPIEANSKEIKEDFHISSI